MSKSLGAQGVGMLEYGPDLAAQILIRPPVYILEGWGVRPNRELEALQQTIGPVAAEGATNVFFQGARLDAAEHRQGVSREERLAPQNPIRPKPFLAGPSR